VILTGMFKLMVNICLSQSTFSLRRFMIYRHVLPGVHPRHWNRIDRLVEQVPRAFWKLLRNRSNAALPTIIEDFLC